MTRSVISIPIFDLYVLRTKKAYSYIEWRTRLFTLSCAGAHDSVSLYIVRTGHDRVICGFNFTQGKEDLIVLSKIRKVLNINRKVNKKSGNARVYKLDSASIQECLHFAKLFGGPFFGVSKMYGMKDFEFYIWCCVLYGAKLSYDRKMELQSIMRYYRANFSYKKA